MSIIYTQLDGDRKCNIAAYGYFVNTFNNIFEVDYGSTPTAKVDIILNLYSSAHAAYFPNPATLQGGTIPARAVIFFICLILCTYGKETLTNNYNFI